MKLKFTLVSALIAVALLASCGKKDEVAPKPVLLNKTATFEIFALKDYTNSYEAEMEATIHLRIYRGEKGKLGEPLVFDSTFTRLLKDLPVEANKIVIRKSIPNVDTEKEFVSLGSGYRVGSFGYGSYDPVTDEEEQPVIKIKL